MKEQLLIKLERTSYHGTHAYLTLMSLNEKWMWKLLKTGKVFFDL